MKWERIVFLRKKYLFFWHPTKDILDIDSHCPYLLSGGTTPIYYLGKPPAIKLNAKIPYLLFGETTSHLTSFKNFKNHTKFKQHSINIKNYTAHPHDMVHVPAKFWENTAMLSSYSAKTRRDRHGRVSKNISRPGPSVRREITQQIYVCKQNPHTMYRYVIRSKSKMLENLLNKRPLGLTAPLSNCLCYTNDI